MSNHKLEAFISKNGTYGFRVVCEDPAVCMLEEDYQGCAYSDYFIATGNLNTNDLTEDEYVLGGVLLICENSPSTSEEEDNQDNMDPQRTLEWRPPWFDRNLNPDTREGAPHTGLLRHGDETTGHH